MRRSLFGQTPECCPCPTGPSNSRRRGGGGGYQNQNVRAASLGPNYLDLQQADFMRSSGAVASRATPVPATYNEAAYLANNPDVKKAVDEGVMPSGLWHFMKYGKNEGRTNYAGYAGWSMRRPGNLAGISDPWRRS